MAQPWHAAIFQRPFCCGQAACVPARSCAPQHAGVLRHRHAIARDSFWKFRFQCATWETKHESEEVAGSNPVVLDVHAQRMQLQHLAVKVTRRCGRLDESVEVADVLQVPSMMRGWFSLPGRRQPNRWSAPARLIRGEIGPHNKLMMDAKPEVGSH